MLGVMAYANGVLEVGDMLIDAVVVSSASARAASVLVASLASLLGRW
jgi:hypothetical protein